jgi:hypothetical protein
MPSLCRKAQVKLQTMFRRLSKFIATFALVLIVLPIAAGTALTYSKGWPTSWRSADWSSSGLLPAATANDEAVVYIMAARSGRWKGIFAVHHWLVLKPKGANRYARYDVVGWGSPVRKDNYPADGRWYSSEPEIVHEVRGGKAETLIPKLRRAVAEYPWADYGDYIVWPGPNSNSFVAHIARTVPELGAELDPAGVGKDWLGPGLQTGRMPSGTGWQVSWNGLIGAGASWREGVELHFLGSTIGVDFDRPAIKLPALGRIGVL